MELIYRDHLLKQVENRYDEKDTFWLRSLVDYLKETLNQTIDFEYAVEVAKTIVPAKNCGTGLNDLMKYFIYVEKTKKLYWFVSASEAMYFVNEVVNKGEKEKSWSVYFKQYRRRKQYGVFWFTAEDRHIWKEVVESPRSIYCVQLDREFVNFDEVVAFICNTKAKEEKRVRRQLEKHLKGETRACYELTFKEV